MKRSVGLYFALFITAIIIAGAVLVFLKFDLGSASQLGDFLSGFAAALAFLWLVVGYFQQNRELRLQREELRMQREALELQKEEMRKIGKYSALQQVSKVLKEFADSVPGRNLPNVANVSHLSTTYILEFAEYIKHMDSRTDFRQTLAAYGRWQPIENTCKEFIASVGTAIRLYVEATKEFYIGTDVNIALFVMTNRDRLSNVPFLQQYMPAAYAVATSLVTTEPGAKRIELAWLEELIKEHPDVVDEDQLQQLRAVIAKGHEGLKRRKNGKEE